MSDESVRALVLHALILEARVMASDCYPATAKLLTRLADALEASEQECERLRLGLREPVIPPPLTRNPPPPQNTTSLFHAYRRMWATERKHLPVSDVAYYGGWQSTETLERIYQRPDDATLLRVATDHYEVREK